MGIDLPGVGQIGIVDLQQKTSVSDGLIFLAHRLRDSEQVSLVAGVIIVFHPMLDRAGRNGGQKGILELCALKRRFKGLDIRFHSRMADVLERPVAEDSLYVLPAHRAEPLLEVLWKFHQVATENHRGALLGFGLSLCETAETLAGVAGKIRLPDFTVVDDVETAVDLLFYDLRNDALHPPGERFLVIRLPAVFRGKHFLKIVRLR